MTLLERIQQTEQTCREPGCKRVPVYPDQAYCADHRLRWTPEWRKRLTAKDLTDRTAA